MALSPTRTVIWTVGLLLIIAGASILFFESGMQAWIPATIAGAGLLLIIGVLVLTFATQAPSDEEGHRDSGSQTIHKEEKHYHE